MTQLPCLGLYFRWTDESIFHWSMSLQTFSTIKHSLSSLLSESVIQTLFRPPTLVLFLSFFVSSDVLRSYYFRFALFSKRNCNLQNLTVVTVEHTKGSPNKRYAHLFRNSTSLSAHNLTKPSS